MCGSIMKDIKTSDSDILGYYELK